MKRKQHTHAHAHERVVTYAKVADNMHHSIAFRVLCVYVYAPLAEIPDTVQELSITGLGLVRTLRAQHSPQSEGECCLVRLGAGARGYTYRRLASLHPQQGSLQLRDVVELQHRMSVERESVCVCCVGAIPIVLKEK